MYGYNINVKREPLNAFFLSVLAIYQEDSVPFDSRTISKYRWGIVEVEPVLLFLVSNDKSHTSLEYSLR